jgi:diguanylate cyclase (GGDEF)-like protein
MKELRTSQGESLKENELKIVTDDTLKELRSLDVITPDTYAVTFNEKLKSLNIDLDLDKIESEAEFTNLDKIFKMQKETQSNTKELKENIDLATVAIDKHDNIALYSIKTQMSSLQQKIDALENIIYIDDLTKVHNRKWLFDKALEDERFKHDGILTFIDLDSFKSINDNYGHTAGDKSLYLIATLLEKIENTKVARLGGDEFLLISKESDTSDIERILDGINRSFEDKSIKYKEHTFKLSISYGSENFKKGEDFNYINELVDSKMYKNKIQKRGVDLSKI